MKIAAVAFVAVSAASCLWDVAYARGAWDAYLAELRDRCPSQHVEWICDGCKDDQIARFLNTLPEEARHRVKTLALTDLSLKCASAGLGFYCEEAVYLETFRKLHLLREYAAYGCRTVTCTEPDLCSKPSK
jgi:hypothetical protein